MKKTSTLISILVCGFLGSKAQVSNMNFAQSAGIYQQFSGTQVDIPNEDDVFHDNLPIGFNFTYNGTTTNKFGVCTNGFIILDSAIHSSYWTLNTNSTNQINVLMADLQNTNVGGSIEFTTIGSAPNRICIIQWKDYGIFSNPYCHLNAQIRLLETSNCIQLCYGYNALSGNLGKSFDVGLIGTTTIDYNLRTTSNNWINSNPSATFPGNGMFLSPLSLLPNGLIFSYGACPASGTPFSYFTGNVYQDANNNGIKDAGENGLANVLVHDNLQNYYTNTDSNGDYSLVFVDSSLTYTLNVVPFMYWNITNNPATYTVTPLVQNTNNRNFGLEPTPNIHDVEISCNATNIPWPTANITFFTTFHNNGTVIEPGDSIFFIKDSLYTFMSSTPSPSYMSGDSLVWIYSNLQVNEYRNMSMVLKADSSIQAGDTLYSYWTIQPINGDVNITNNHLAINQLCSSSFDPNSKEVSPEGNILNTQELNYTIHFQNTGTAPALNVFLHDTLDQNLDVNTFKLLNFSHPVTYTVDGTGALHFTFANINLPDSNANVAASQGLVSYSIKPKVGLAVASQIHNTAHIIFDYNAAIVTNTTLNIIIQNIPSSFSSINKQALVNIYPNPAHQSISLQSDISMKNAQVTIYDITGKISMHTNINADKNASIDISNLKQGIYIIQVTQGENITKKKIDNSIAIEDSKFNVHL